MPDLTLNRQCERLMAMSMNRDVCMLDDECLTAALPFALTGDLRSPAGCLGLSSTLEGAEPGGMPHICGPILSGRVY